MKRLQRLSDVKQGLVREQAKDTAAVSDIPIDAAAPKVVIDEKAAAAEKEREQKGVEEKAKREKKRQERQAARKAEAEKKAAAKAAAVKAEADRRARLLLPGRAAVHRARPF